MSEPKLGWMIEREGCPGRIFAGVTLDEVAACLKTELQDDIESGFSVDDMSPIVVKPTLITQEEIDNLPDFEGW